MPILNEFGQPVGPNLGDWTSPPFPEPVELHGQYVDLVPLRFDHAGALYKAFETAPDSTWTYMSMGPFRNVAGVETAIAQMSSYPDRHPYSILVDGEPLGFASYLRIDPPVGVIEIGSIAFSTSLQRTREATESIFLLIDHVFALGYRRCEWKCDHLNEPSRRAADRFGFEYEGTFRNATHYKGRSRDTAWYAVVDRDWHDLRGGYDLWLSPDNYDGADQRKSLRDFIARTSAN